VLEPKDHPKKATGSRLIPEWKGPDVGGVGAFGVGRERAWISLSGKRSVKRLPDQNIGDWIAAAEWPARCFVLSARD
jgi:hypothetical protein